MPVIKDIPPELKTEPVLEADARAFGLTTKLLQRSGFRHVHRGVFVWRGLEDSPELQYDAAQLTMDRIALASHQTAAQLHGLPVPGPKTPHFWLPEGEKGRDTRGLHVHWYKVGQVPAYTMVDNRRATTIGKTFVDLATQLGLFDLVAYGDAAIKRPGVTIDLLRQLSLERGRRHIRKARQAVDLIRDRVDSPPETHLRLLMLLAGLPEPKVNLKAYDAAGEWIATPDLSYPEVKLAIEYDGSHHGRRRKQWKRDVDRNAIYLDNGWIVIVVLAEHLYQRPHLLLDRIVGHLRDRGLPDLPDVLSGAWEPYLREIRN
ncbi:hypothetical protein [Solicola gregarius]|uniref:DUF559 domain-containing protein n=1 Tax=Solicola gregarius TaxID=2908642 RepID=A0AA46TE86_9ACTN|nr:hypothetical protein [Solicola gregarius]UYM03744.1 hypothetical protein L0C25_14470 [Solicola gregarius]